MATLRELLERWVRERSEANILYVLEGLEEHDYWGAIGKHAAYAEVLQKLKDYKEEED